MEVIRGTLWKRRLSIPIKLPGKNNNICLSERAYQHKGTRKKCKKTNQAAIIQWQRQCLMDKPHRKPGLKSKTSDISKQSPSPLHHTFLLGRARFTAQPLSALVMSKSMRNIAQIMTSSPVEVAVAPKRLHLISSLMLQCWRRTGHLLSFFVPTPGDFTAQESPPPRICRPRQKNANSRGSSRGRGGGLGAGGIDWCIKSCGKILIGCVRWT